MNETSKVATYEATTYRKDGVTFVPHYRNSAVFVGPGYPRYNLKRYSETELLDAGAVKLQTSLWQRGTTGAVTDANP